MKDELITYETAVLAEEKGFEGMVYAMYDAIFGYLDYTRVNEYDKYSYDLFHSTAEVSKTAFPAPTQSLLQRWLREEHDITVNAYRTWAMHCSYNYSVLQGNDVDNEIIQACEPNRTYEQALEAGLQEALKLIRKAG